MIIETILYEHFSNWESESGVGWPFVPYDEIGPILKFETDEE